MIFKNKNILITGASSGIGRQIALDLSNKGASLVLLGRDIEKLEETKKICRKGSSVILLSKDLTDNDLLLYLSNSIKDSFDGIVFNAGKIKVNPIGFVAKDDIDDIFDANTKSHILFTKFLLRNKKVNENGSFVFVSSISTVKPTVGNSIYNASKSALNGFARSLALEVAAKKIRVNTIMPGFIETNFFGTNRSQEEIEKHLLTYPLGRFGSPKDVSALACFLLSDDASWITGAQIPIDGGFSMK
jgi:NAD(P)-dependent dehydrogenase (short-subunit alcohol dehydrogenase family)